MSAKSKKRLDWSSCRIKSFTKQLLFFKRNAEAQANQSIQLYFTHSQLHGQINNDNITDSEKTYTNGTPEWVDLDKIDGINFRHSVSLREILGAYSDGK